MIDYSYVDVKELIVNALRIEYDNNGYNKVGTRKADAVEAGHIPCVCVNRIDDSESNQTISDVVDSTKDPDTGKWVETTGTYFSESLEIRVWHTNADERDALYILTKAVLFAMRKDLTAKGLLNIRLRGGKDEQDSSLLAMPVYWAAVNMEYLNPLEVRAIIQDEDGTGTITQIITAMEVITE